jgi:hypothetical protein
MVVMKTLYKLFLILIFMCSINITWAQWNPEFLDKGGNINIYGGITYPSSEFSATTSNGLFAKNAFQFGIEGNYIIKYGLGIGLDLGGEWFKFDKQAFSNYANPETIDVKGSYSSSFFGINFVANIPIVFDKKHFTVNLFVVGTPGLRGIRIPSIDLTYDELINRYVEVSYRSRANTQGYLAYRGGIQFLFNNTFGLSLSYKGVKRDQLRLNYSVRLFDAEGELYEEENYLNSYFNSESYQIGLIFLLGVN